MQKIMAIPPPMREDGADMRIWPGDKPGRFSVSSAYSMLQGHHEMIYLIQYGSVSGDLMYRSEFVAFNLKATVTVADSVEWTVVWATSCYYLWRWRNRLKFDANFVRPLHTHIEIMKYVDYYYKAKPTSDVALKGSRRRVDVRWKAPQRDWICLNTD
ncbi:ribonuclease H, partial [Trifolium medium]|nr:ribonuclease H [Trifolium medium]